MAGWRLSVPTSSSKRVNERVRVRHASDKVGQVIRGTDSESVMRRFWKFALLMPLCILVPAIATAQRSCQDGRTVTGQCVNAGLAESMRQAGVIYSQPKLSYTAYPVLPVLDFIFRFALFFNRFLKNRDPVRIQGRNEASFG